MSKARLGIAAGNTLGTDAAKRVALAGGNAVDACLASAVMGWVAEPFFASIGGSGFITVRTPDGTVEVIDGNTSMPLTEPAEPGQGARRIFLPDYADGLHMGIGGGSVAVPGVLAAVRTAWERHGKIEWAALFEDAIAVARDGFPFPKVSDYYLTCTWENIWSTYGEAREVFGTDGLQMREGDTMTQPELAEALRAVADDGVDVFYNGPLGEEIVATIQRDGGFMTLDDLKSYKAEIRKPVSTTAFGWQIDSNPPPAVGGAVLVHLLAILEDADISDPVKRLTALVEAQRMAVGYRRERYHEPEEVSAAFEEALAAIQHRSQRSSETTHASSADADGNVCSITESNGYGSGLIVHGMPLNNTLGEEELNPMGMHRIPPGSRTHSNMAPTIASRGGRAVALGSPGADRIVSAIAQSFMRIAIDGDPLADALAAPRAHLDPRPDGETLCFEPGLPGEALPYQQRPYEEIHMFFGGVQAASVDEDGTVDAAHDPRRSGGSALV